MRERLIALRERRAQLLARAAVEREAFGAFIDRTDTASRWMETAARVFTEARQRPALVVAGTALLLALRPRRVLDWTAKGFTLYQLYRRGRRLWDRIAPGIVAARRAASAQTRPG